MAVNRFFDGLLCTLRGLKQSKIHWAKILFKLFILFILFNIELLIQKWKINMYSRENIRR